MRFFLSDMRFSNARPWFSCVFEDFGVKNNAKTRPRTNPWLVYANVLKKTLFLDILANFGHFQWSNLAKNVKGTSTGHHLSYEPIPRSLRPSVTKKQPGKAHVSKTADFTHFGQFRPFPVAEPGQKKRHIYRPRPFIWAYSHVSTTIRY